MSPRTAVAAAACGLALAAMPAAAATHDYCFWDGSNSHNTALVKCYQSGENYLTNNHAWLVFSPTLPTIYCGANLNGSQYANPTSGNPSCNHAYGGGNLLKAWEFVDISAWTHAEITW